MPGRPDDPARPADADGRAREVDAGLASWPAGDLAALVLPAWDEFLDLAAGTDLDAPSRVRGWSARDVCVHLGSWPGSRSLERLRTEAAAGDEPPHTDLHTATFDQQSHNEALLDAWGAAPRERVLDALREGREEVAGYLASDEHATLGRRPVRSVLGALPLSTLVGAGAYELAVHALDLAPAGAPRPSAALLSAGLAALVDTTGGLAARSGIAAHAACLSPEGDWAFASSGRGWTTVADPGSPHEMAAVQGRAADLLDASAGRRAVPAMLARRELRLQHVTGLLALAPIIETVPGLPGGAALRAAVHNVRALSRLVRRLPGVPR